MIKALTHKALFTDTGINYTNMGLMVLSLLVAFYLPFHLFLFVYAVLGPLHYLTEISWLDKRNFFTKNKYDIWLFIFTAILLTIGVFNHKSKVNAMSSTLIFTALVYAIILFTTKNTVLKYVLVLFVFVFTYSAKADTVIPFFVTFGALLPTIIHVFIFTALFILFGALKTKSKSGIFSFFLLLTCAIIIFFLPDGNYVQADETTRKNISTYFIIINKALAYVFGSDAFKSVDDYFSHSQGIAIMRFIAFAYTYHYLNWFSKTSVIKWHEISKIRMGMIAGLWIISVFLYYLDYRIGFNFLFLLSMLHVFLEFPLNIHSISGIYHSLVRK